MYLICILALVSGLNLRKSQSELESMALAVEALTATYADDTGTVRLSPDMLEYENIQLSELLNAMNEDSRVSIDSVIYDPPTLDAQIRKTEDFIKKLRADNQMLVVTPDRVMSFQDLN